MFRLCRELLEYEAYAATEVDCITTPLTLPPKTKSSSGRQEVGVTRELDHLKPRAFTNGRNGQVNSLINPIISHLVFSLSLLVSAETKIILPLSTQEQQIPARWNFYLAIRKNNLRHFKS